MKIFNRIALSTVFLSLIVMTPLSWAESTKSCCVLYETSSSGQCASVDSMSKSALVVVVKLVSLDANVGSANCSEIFIRTGVVSDGLYAFRGRLNLDSPSGSCHDQANFVAIERQIKNRLLPIISAQCANSTFQFLTH